MNLQYFQRISQLRMDVYIYSLQYHIVWCTKYRKKILLNGLEKEAAEHIKESAKALQMDIIVMELMPDHIHILADCKPQLRLSDAIKILKGNTSRSKIRNQRRCNP